MQIWIIILIAWYVVGFVGILIYMNGTFGRITSMDIVFALFIGAMPGPLVWIFILLSENIVFFPKKD